MRARTADDALTVAMITFMRMFCPARGGESLVHRVDWPHQHLPPLGAASVRATKSCSSRWRQCNSRIGLPDNDRISVTKQLLSQPSTPRLGHRVPIHLSGHPTNLATRSEHEISRGRRLNHPANMRPDGFRNTARNVVRAINTTIFSKDP